MKISHIVLLIFIATIFSNNSFAQKGSAFSNEFIDIWKRASEYSIEVAEAMPEEYYKYRLNENTFTFSQQLAHIITNLYWLNSTFIANESNPIKDAKLDDLSKNDLIKSLKDVFTYVEKSASEISDKQSKDPVIFAGVIMDKKRIFYLMRDHLTHHRAQCITYLRLNNIEPPKYRGW
ncbi:DinB family protein [Chondrinema litorale]|uniref:DinB family protein n=1 Tax=Chondrinema litorale TaxID=2994555 RepID=UPI002543473E|nr:DinB family protein [Chondrinema litorale]UZR92294.1 DinB family protein [Chondrinema litorale]